MVLGGGKQAHMRGGDIRRVVIHSDALQGADVMDVFHRLANDHPGIGGRATRIQAIYRGFINRKKRDEEIARNKAEFDRENAEEEEVKEAEPTTAVEESKVQEDVGAVEPTAVEAVTEETISAEEVAVAN